MKQPRQKPNLRPVTDFKLISDLIYGSFDSAKILYDNFLEAKDKPHVLSDSEYDRAIKLYNSELEISYCFDEQIAYWKKLVPINDEKYQELQKMEKVRKEYVDLSKKIIELATDLRQYSINALLGIDDMAWGLAALLREHKK